MFHRLTAGDLEFLGLCGVLFWVFCLGFVCLVVWFAPYDFEVNLVVCEVVCEVERPSELSWRARHGRKKIEAWKDDLRKDEGPP